MITIPTSNRAEKPKGAPFYVDRVPFRPGERVDVARFTLADDKVFNWPMVYMFMGYEKCAYAVCIRLYVINSFHYSFSAYACIYKNCRGFCKHHIAVA